MARKALKQNKGIVEIKAEEVLIGVFARGLLSYPELRIAFDVIADSWRWRNSRVTQRPMNFTRTAERIDMDRRQVARTARSMVEQGKLILCSDLRTRKVHIIFEEHPGRWGGTPSPTGTHSPMGLPVTPNGTPSPPKGDSQSRLLHYKNNIKGNSNSNTPAKKRAGGKDEICGLFIKHWCEVYRQQRDRPYRVRPMDVKKAKNILQCVSLEEAKAAAVRFIQSTDRWVRENTRIAILDSRLNDFLGDNSHGPTADRALKILSRAQNR